MKEFVLRSLGIGLIVVGLVLIIHAFIGLSNLLNNKVEGYFRPIYMGFVIFETVFGAVHGFLGYNVFRLRRKPVNVALVFSLAVACLTVVFSRAIPDPWDRIVLPYLMFSIGFFYYSRNPVMP